MPMTYTDQLVDEQLVAYKSQIDEHLASLGLESSEPYPNKRERLAQYIESKYRDYIGAWEIRTGRPWTDMSWEEAQVLVAKQPSLLSNPGMLSILARK